jgi:hypothetical protein
LKVFRSIFKQLCSLKLAVMVILALACALAAGTILESLYDTPNAQFWVYRSRWFAGVMGLLGVNIFCVALSRWPWKKKHIPFLLAHLGILTLLAGSWVTEKKGIDGSLRFSEGENASTVDLESASLVVADGKKIFRVGVPWLPPSVPFKEISASEFGVPFDLKIDRFLSHADSVVSFVPETKAQLTSHAEQNKTAILLKVTGGPMKISQELWLWEGSPEWQNVQAGPAKFSIQRGNSPVETGHVGPSLVLVPNADGSLDYRSQSSDGKQFKGHLAQGAIEGKKISPGWRGDVKIAIEKWVPNARIQADYKPARIQYGAQAPLSAIHVTAAHQAVDVWLGLGDRAILHLDQQEVELGYFSKRIVLPFSVRLDRFTVEHDQGTMNPASYSSRVTVTDAAGQRDVLISMNEPLEHRGFTLYQASYEDADPRPVTSILTVNQDPGRVAKYTGSALIVLGSILLFAAKYRQARQQRKQSPSRKGSAMEVLGT